MSGYRRPPNLFWPILLIGVGVLLLLANLNVIETINIAYLLQLWPLVLIALGIEVLFGRGNAWIGNILSAALVIAALAFLVYAPQLNLGISPAGEYITESFSAEIEDATSANIHLDIDEGDLTVAALEDSGNLIEIEAFHNQNANFRESGSRTKSINFNLDSFRISDFTNLFDADRTEITAGLSSRIPLSLNIDTGSASTALNLEELQLLELSADTGSGRIQVWLPAGDFPVDLGTGSGSIEVTVPAGSVLDLTAGTGSGSIALVVGEDASGRIELDSGSGNLTLEVPEGTALQVSGETGSGNVSLPSGFIRTRGEDSLGGASGTWQSPNFDDAQIKLFVKFEVGSGNFRLIEK